MNWRWGAILWASVCLARPFEAGGMGGYGLYRNASVDGPGGTATAGFANRFAIGAVFGEDMYPHLSGEIRYLFQDGAPFVSAAGVRGNTQGQSHALSYDLLLEPFRRERRIRPYAVAGVGIKYFRSTGPEPAVQPLPDIVTLVNRSELRVLAVGGAGVRYRLRDRVYVRADFVDYITPFPKKLFVPAPGGTSSGILHQLTPTVGITFQL